MANERTFATRLRRVIPWIIGGVILLVALDHYRSHDRQAFHTAAPALEEAAEAEAFERGMQAWLGEDYPAAAAALEDYLLEVPEDTEAGFYLGLSYLETGREEQAARVLDRVRFNDTRYYAEATWYLAHCRLKTGDMPAAYALLAELQDGPDRFWQEKARLVMENFWP